MNKKFFCFITILFILITGYFGLAQELPSLIESIPTPPPVISSPSSVAVPTSNLYQYAEPTYEFRFNYPDNWEPYTETEGSLKAEIDLLEEGHIIAAFSVYVEDTDLSLFKYAMAVEEWMIEPQNMPEYKKISEEAVNLGTLSAIKRLYTWTRINSSNNTRIPIKAIDMYLVQDKKGYILEGQVTQDQFDKILNDINFMFNSFVLIEKPEIVSTPAVPELPIVVSAATEATTTSGIPESAFKYCPYCGVSLQPDFKFCPGCGNPIPSVPRSLTKKEDKLSGARGDRNRGVDYLPGLIPTRGFQGEGSSIKTIGSNIGALEVEQKRFFSLGGTLSVLGQEITSEIGIKREVETLPSLIPTAPQTAPQTIPSLPGIQTPTTGIESTVSPTPEVPAPAGINLTPPGQPVPTPPGPSGITLPVPGSSTTQVPDIIWKQYSLNQAFSHNPMIYGNLDYPSTWLVNLDSFNRNVTFSEDASGITSLTLYPGLMGQFTSAQDLTQQMTYLLQQQIPNLAIINQEYKILPTPGSGAIEITAGKVNLQGNYQGTLLRFDLEALVMYAGAYGSANGMGYAILTQAPSNIFVEKEQKYFNRMILSYKRALGIEK